jgi:hypothetical protein
MNISVYMCIFVNKYNSIFIYMCTYIDVVMMMITIYINMYICITYIHIYIGMAVDDEVAQKIIHQELETKNESLTSRLHKLESDIVLIEEQLNDTILSLQEVEERERTLHNNFTVLQEQFDLLKGSNKSLLVTQTLEITVHEKTINECEGLKMEYEKLKETYKEAANSENTMQLNLLAMDANLQVYMHINIYLFVYTYIFVYTYV